MLISVNPNAGARSGGYRIVRLVRLLTASGLHAQVFTDLNEVAGAANRYSGQGTLRALVGAGGDGTAAELVNRTEPGVPLAMLPLGTENLLAKYLRQRPTPEAVCRTIRDGLSVRLDAGVANGRTFLLMAGCGFDAEVVRRLHDSRRGHIHHTSYFKPILSTIRSYEYPPLRVYCDRQPSGGQPTVTACWLFAFNLPRYGGGLQFAPDAVGSDGLLDVCTFRRGSFWHGLRYLAHLICRRHARLADCVTTRTARLRVESDRPVPYQLDGDPGGWLPLDVEVVPERLCLVVPRAWATAQGCALPAEVATGSERK